MERPNMTTVTLALIETGANQRYLFGTNKLAHAVGASHLTREATTTWVSEAAAQVGISAEARVETDGAEVALATSGKALVLLPDAETARSLVFAVTSRGLADAPGLRLHGAISDPFEWGSGFAGAVGQVHSRAREARSAADLNDLRFPRLPVARGCRYTPRPAACERFEGETPVAVAHEIAAKAHARDDGYKRLRQIISAGEHGLPADLGELEVRLTGDEKWVGVIHADGNGLGEVFTAFDRHLRSALGHAPNDRESVDALRRLSGLLEAVTEKALREACEQTWQNGHPLVLPLVVGGDDLTLVCEGRVAHDFGAKFASSFVRMSAEAVAEPEQAVTAGVLGSALASPAVGMSVDVAITKPHFPFSTGHDLAVELLTSAKQVKGELVDANGQAIPTASLDFHVLFDSTHADLATLRTLPPSKIAASAGPFVVDPPAEATSEWLHLHTWSALRSAVTVLKRQEDGRRVIPSSQSHGLRTALLSDRAEAKQRLGVLHNRHGAALAGSGLEGIEAEPGCGFTRWIDAMTLADLELT